MQSARDHQGLTLIEVLIAAAILAVGLLALVSAFPIGYVDVAVSGGQSKATSYAQQKLQELKNQVFSVAFDNCPPVPLCPGQCSQRSPTTLHIPGAGRSFRSREPTRRTVSPGSR